VSQETQQKSTAKTVRVLTLILASPLFFVVSCTSSSWFIGDALSRWQAVKHPLRYAGAVIARKDGAFEYLESQREIDWSEQALSEYEKAWDGFTDYVDAPEYPYTFLLPQSEGRITIDELRHVRFEVSRIGAEEQEITVWDIDDDYGKEIVYRARQTQITPIYSRIFGVGHVMGAWPYALVVAFAIYGVGRSLKRRQEHARQPHCESPVS